MTVQTETADQKPKGASSRDVLLALRQPRVLITLLLGFSSGLPFMLTGNTLGYWLREEGVELAAIGFLSWVGIAYSMKFLWAPIVDKVDVPLLGRLGRRRGWIVLSQVLIGAGLFAMAAIGPGGGLLTFAGFALLVAFASATQDIVVDAWRIERAESDADLGLLTAAFQLGYRIAILVTDALILIAAAKLGWNNSYVLCALAVGVGLTATLFATEPARIHPEQSAAQRGPALWTPRGLADAIVGPFVAFFRSHGAGAAVLMLAAISLYRLPDFVMGPMANPLYVDLGLSKETVGGVRATIGLGATFVGIALAGLSAVRLGFVRTLVLGAILGPGSNLAFAALAYAGPSATALGTAIAVDNVATGFAGAALVAYMSSLTSLGYTATQYALLSSFYALLGKVLKGFSGTAVEALQRTYEPMTAYAIFFTGTALVGIPALVLCLMLGARHRREQRIHAQAAPDPDPAAAA
ncbi:AmpG family muropeptide MFS transporter [Phenylobacterium sp.]|jgi:PAT family beta-lactamase induction signal transducer AmpG|uniref:AmpG family muropeptide MFS transporter n=1 Tax=Phenylobacterium sp. TaxID=1871053 RepID=UPI003783EB7F